MAWPAAAAMLLSTCVVYTSRTPNEDARLMHGRGSQVIAWVSGQALEGELLSADTTGIVLMLSWRDSTTIRMVPMSAITTLGLRGMLLGWRVPLSRAHLDRVRSNARFPYGMSMAATSVLLRETGRVKIDTVRDGVREGVHDSVTSAFLVAARAATERYQSADAALADGFKRVGTEFPFMGEHWVNLPRVLENRFDASHPTVLTYVNAPAGRMLAGVAYTALLGAGEAPPASPAPASAWHEHNGAIADESLPIHGSAGGGEGAHGAHEPRDSLRLAVLHAWVWTPNTAGAFVTDNAALPLVRLGANAALSGDALAGLTLAQDSAGYYAQTIRSSLQASEGEARVVAETIRGHRASAARELRGTAVDAAVLRLSWGALWRDLERRLPERARQLAEVRVRLEQPLVR